MHLPKRIITIALLFLFFSTPLFAQHHGRHIFERGTYSGFIEFKNPHKVFLTVLTLVEIDEQGEEIEGQYTRLSAHLKIKIGDHGSHEYINHFYHGVSFSHEDGNLKFNSHDTGLSITNIKIHIGKFVTKVRSLSTPQRGDLTAFYTGSNSGHGGGHNGGDDGGHDGGHGDDGEPGDEPGDDGNNDDGKPGDEPGNNAHEPGDEPGDNGNSHDHEGHFQPEATKPMKPSPAEIEKMKGHVKALSGEYKGTCKGEKESLLQIETFRRVDSSPLGFGNPFRPYSIRARIGSLEHRVTILGDTKVEEDVVEVVNGFDSGTYNFYTNVLNLFGLPQTERCQVDGNKIKCDSGCSFQKTVSGHQHFSWKPTKHKRTLSLIKDMGEEVSGEPKEDELNNVYYGYLHIENNNKYMPLSLNVLAEKIFDIPHNMERLYISASASLQLGSFNSVETLIYNFKQRRFKKPALPWLELQGDSDIVLKIIEWNKNGLRGIWYSKIFGEVGTVNLIKGSLPELLPKSALIPSLSGSYDNTERSLVLSIAPSQTDEASMTNPFFPLNIRGTFNLKSLGKNINIVHGVLDFYMGRISFETEEGIVVTNTLAQKERLKLFWPGDNTFGSRIIDSKFDVFTKK